MNYNKIDWQNTPSTQTPISAENLNHMEQGIYDAQAKADDVEAMLYALQARGEAATAADMTDTSKVYIYTGSEAGYTFGDWYYYNGSAWVSGGAYNSTAVNTDTTLLVQGAPADAKATGEAIAKSDNALLNNPNSVFDDDGYANIMDFGDYIKGKFYNISGTLTANANIIGSTKAIKLPKGTKVLEITISQSCSGNSVVSFWTSETASAQTFISATLITTSGGTIPRTILALVPDNAKYFRIPFYNFDIEIFVSSYLLTGVVNGDVNDGIISTMQHYTRNSETGVLETKNSTLMSALFTPQNHLVAYGETGYSVASIEYVGGEAQTIQGWTSAIELRQSKQYRLLFKKDGNALKINELKNLHLDFGCSLGGGLTSLEDITEPGWYFLRQPNIGNIDDLPSDYTAQTALLKVDRYHNGVNRYFVQTLYAIVNPPYTYFRYISYTGSAWCDWVKVDTVNLIIPSLFNGKKLSIFGDSISTYAGWIPDGNAVYYTGSNCGVSSVNDTWWKKLIDALGFDLVVNNSWSGRCVGTARDSEPAHSTDAGYKEANVLQLKDGDTLPEVIIVKLGINDFNYGGILGDYDGSTALPDNPNTFTNAYAIMLDLIMTDFPLAKVYCCTLMQCERTGTIGFPEINRNGDSLIEWNEAIRKLAHAFGAEILDHDTCGITYYNLSTYAGDWSGSTKLGLHPNAAGHSLIANATIHQMDNAVRTRY